MQHVKETENPQTGGSCWMSMPTFEELIAVGVDHPYHAFAGVLGDGEYSRR